MSGRDLGASVRQRLLNQSRAQERPFQELLQYFAMERFLYRLSKSPSSDRFILKGALLLTAWRAPQSRPTMDIDLAGRTSNELDHIAELVGAVCEVVAEPDGVEFKRASIEVSRIKEDADYEGVRVRFHATLAKARIPMQIDIGFGDVIVPGPTDVEYYTSERALRARLELIWRPLDMFGPASSWRSQEPYFVHAWNQSGMSFDAARELAQEPLTLLLALHLYDLFGLEAILADSFATAGLRKHLIDNHPNVRKALARYAAPPKPKAKRGPKAFKDGKSKTEIALERRAAGVPPWTICEELYNDPNKVKTLRTLLWQADHNKDDAPEPVAANK